MQSLIPSADDREQVEFYVSCRNLKNMDVMSKSDPQVRLYFNPLKTEYINVDFSEFQFLYSNKEMNL